MANKSAKSKTARKAKAKAKVVKKRVVKKSAVKKAAATKRAVKKAAGSKKKTTKKAKSTRKRATKASPPSAGMGKSRRGSATSKSTKAVSPRATASKGAVGKKTGRDIAPPVAPKPAPPKKRLKTPLTAKQLRGFKALLLAKRTELTGDMMNMTQEALNRHSGTGAESSSVPTHLAERGSDNWEQEFTLGLIANEKIVVREIDAALERIENRTYGICLGTEEPISIARLEAKPWARHGIEFARLRDEGRAP